MASAFCARSMTSASKRSICNRYPPWASTWFPPGCLYPEPGADDNGHIRLPSLLGDLRFGMRLDKFTLKAQEAIQEGQSLARRADHPNYEPEHLAQALLTQQEGT